MGLTIVIFFISFGDGVYFQMVDDAARMQSGHITIENPDYRQAPAVDLWVEGADEVRRSVSGLKEVENAKLLILGQGVARSGNGAIGAAVMGVEPSVEKTTSFLAKHINKGGYLEDTDGAMVVVGSKLAKQLKLDIGKKMVLTANDANGILVEELLRVKGIFETGVPEIDGYLLQSPIGFARKFFGLPDGAATQVGIVLYDAVSQQKRARREVGAAAEGRPVKVLSWYEVMPELASYIKMDKTSNVVFQGILLFLILFTIYNTIMMSVMERRREFAMLMAVGTPVGLLRAQVVMESIFIALIGCAAGLACGWGVSAVTGSTGIDISRMLPEGSSVSGFAVSMIMYPRATFPTLVWPTGIVFMITFLISVLSIRKIHGGSIADTIRDN